MPAEHHGKAFLNWLFRGSPFVSVFFELFRKILSSEKHVRAVGGSLRNAGGPKSKDEGPAFNEPIDRAEAALAAEQDRLAARDVGDTVHLA